MSAYPNFSSAEFQKISDTLGAVAGDCRDSPELRAELDADPRAFLAGRGMEFPAGAELRVAANTPEVFHLVMPSDPNATVSDEALSGVAGGSSGRPGCASTASTLPSCLGCASSVADRGPRF